MYDVRYTLSYWLTRYNSSHILAVSSETKMLIHLRDTLSPSALGLVLFIQSNSSLCLFLFMLSTVFLTIIFIWKNLHYYILMSMSIKTNSVTYIFLILADKLFTLHSHHHCSSSHTGIHHQ